MKTALHTLLAALVAAVVSGQEASITVGGFAEEQASSATKITIDGPATAKSGDVVVLKLGGTPAIDLAKPLTDQLTWLVGQDRMFAYVLMPQQPMVPLDVEGTIVFGQQGATMRPQVTFPAGQNGEYRLIVDWNFGQDQLVEHVVTVGGGPSPDPFPQPQPEPQPLPPGSRLVLILSESATRTPQEVATTQALHRHCLSLKDPPQFRLLDPSQTPEWAKSLQAEVQKRGVKLPALVVSVLPSSTNAAPTFGVVETLPGRAQEAIATVEEALK